MNLVVDIGNSALKLALYDSARRVHIERVDARAWHQRESALTRLLKERQPASATIVSVVPDQARASRQILDEAGISTVLEVTPFIDLPFDIAYETPETLGNDRIAAAAGAWLHWKDEATTVLAVDAGTATTVEIVSEGTYRGGVIAPGARLLSTSLANDTAQLPEVALQRTSFTIGRTTHQAMQSGLYHLFVDGVGGIIERCISATPGPHKVICTGGWAQLLTEELSVIDHAVPHLVLDGAHALLKRRLVASDRD